MGAVLSAADTARLTGYVRPSKQIEWLRRNGFQEGVNYYLNAAGYPIVWEQKQNEVAEPELGPVP